MDFLSRRRSKYSRNSERRLRRQRGTASVEMIVVLPALLLMLFGTIDFGLLFRDWLVIGHSARVAARTATMYHHSCNPAIVQGLTVADGKAALQAGGVTGGNITITEGVPCSQNRVTVRASANFQPAALGAFVPFFSGGIPLAASAQMRGEY
jgi:Flp pilus assembly protein TadG